MTRLMAELETRLTTRLEDVGMMWTHRDVHLMQHICHAAGFSDLHVWNATLVPSLVAAVLVVCIAPEGQHVIWEWIHDSC